MPGCSPSDALLEAMPSSNRPGGGCRDTATTVFSEATAAPLPALLFARGPPGSGNDRLRLCCFSGDLPSDSIARCAHRGIPDISRWGGIDKRARSKVFFHRNVGVLLCWLPYAALAGSPWGGTAVVPAAAALVRNMTLDEKLSMIWGRWVSCFGSYNPPRTIFFGGQQ